MEEIIAKFTSDTGLMSKVCKECRELKNVKTAQLKIDERSKLAHLKRYSNVQKICKNDIIQEIKLKLR